MLDWIRNIPVIIIIIATFTFPDKLGISLSLIVTNVMS